jgi:hypothetical protein
MTPAPAAVLRQPSWFWPITIGAAATLLLHLPVLSEHLLWVVLCSLFGVTGMVSGLLPAWLALRRDPTPTLGSGFAVAFTAVGLGVCALAVLTLAQGFVVLPADEAMWREELLRQEMKQEAIDEFFARLRGGEGGSWVALGSAFVAFGGGLAGATVAAIRGRRRSK